MRHHFMSHREDIPMFFLNLFNLFDLIFSLLPSLQHLIFLFLLLSVGFARQLQPWVEVQPLGAQRSADSHRGNDNDDSKLLLLLLLLLLMLLLLAREWVVMV